MPTIIELPTVFIPKRREGVTALDSTPSRRVDVVVVEPNPPAEIRERRRISGSGDGGNGSTPSASARFFQLDDDEALSDLAESDSEVNTHTSHSSIEVICCFYRLSLSVL